MQHGGFSNDFVDSEALTDSDKKARAAQGRAAVSFIRVTRISCDDDG